ncbi:MFS transporter [Niabella hibiscisoli]|nr:MFS transporter [Niabella hibiscisoli]MCH5715646.1 MFS transporter [Niabella hibiscisoli]
MYDWANSVYNLVITTTFFPIYFLAVTSDRSDHKVNFLGREFVNSSLYDYVLAVAYLFIALLYPILTSIADTRGNKKNFMRFFCYMGALGCSALFFLTAIRLGWAYLRLCWQQWAMWGAWCFTMHTCRKLQLPRTETGSAPAAIRLVISAA